MQREEGFYWVKYGSEPEVAAWFAGEWALFSACREYASEEFEWIGERIPEPVGEAA